MAYWAEIQIPTRITRSLQFLRLREKDMADKIRFIYKAT